MKTIEIKSTTGNLLFTHTCENNTVAITVTEAVKRSANLYSANLYSADLYSADLYSADLRYADLRSANLRYADLRSANLYSANLYSANLYSANLYSAKYSKDITIDNCFFIDGLYKYRCGAIISDNKKNYIKLGCYTRLVSEWEEDFWNNTKEFPNDNSVESNLRVLAFETCKKWLEINSVKS